MFAITLTPLLLFLQNMPTVLVSLLTLLSCYAIIVLMLKLFQEAGLYLYTTLAVIACNLQVLKATTFFDSVEPIAMGTILYSTTFLASDALTEIYSASKARISVGISFVGSLSLLIMMIFSLGHAPLAISETSEHFHFNQAHNALELLFNPNLAILTASLLAYSISQLADIYIFSKLKQLTRNKHLALRAFVAIGVAAALDSIIFNLLAWKLFSPLEISWHSLIFTYMIGGYILQIIVAMCNLPALYLLTKIIKRN